MSLHRKSKLNKTLIVVALFVAISAVIIIIAINWGGEATEQKENYIAIHRVVGPEYTVELKVRLRDREQQVFVNGEAKEAIGITTKEPRVCLELSEVVGGGSNLLAEDRVDPITWESNLDKSSRYIAFLKDAGYTEIRTQQTADFIEIYMGNNANIKRIVILKDVILVADSINDRLSDIDNTLAKWMEE